MIIDCTRDNLCKHSSPLVCTIIVGRSQNNAKHCGEACIYNVNKGHPRSGVQPSVASSLPMRLKNTIFLLIFSTFSLVAQINTQRLLDIGRNALYFEDYIVAIQNFNQVIKAKPYLTEPYLFRAFAKLNLEDYYGAISDCDAALEINPFLPKVYYCRGIAYRQLGDLENSTLDLKKSLEFDPNNLNTSCLMIENMIRLKKNDEALISCNNLIEEYPSHVNTYILRSQIYLSQQDTTLALMDLDSAIVHNKFADLPYAIRGMIRYNQKDYTSALQDLNDAIRLNLFRADYFGNRAIIKMNLNDLRGSMQDFDQAIEMDKLNPNSYFNRSLLRAMVGDENRALEDLNTAIALEPDNYNAYFQRAILEYKLGEYKKSIADYTLILEVYPDFVPAYYGRSEVYKKLRQTTNANKDIYTAQKIEEEIKSGRRAPKSAQDKDIKLDAEAKAIVHNINTEVKDKYKSEIRGQVQYNDIDIEPLANFIIGLPKEYDPIQSKRWHNADLDKYNNNHNSNLQFCIKNDLKVEDYTDILADFDSLIATKSLSIAYFNRGNARLKEIENLSAELKDNAYLDYQAAINDFTKAYQTDSSLIYALYNIGYVYLLEQNFKKAIETFNKLIEINPEFAESYYNRGLIYIFQNNIEKGREDLSRAGELGLHGAYNILRRYAQ